MSFQLAPLGERPWRVTIDDAGRTLVEIRLEDGTYHRLDWIGCRVDMRAEQGEAVGVTIQVPWLAVDLHSASNVQ